MRELYSLVQHILLLARESSMSSVSRESSVSSMFSMSSVSPKSDSSTFLIGVGVNTAHSALDMVFATTLVACGCDYLIFASSMTAFVSRMTNDRGSSSSLIFFSTLSRLVVTERNEDR